MSFKIIGFAQIKIDAQTLVENGCNQDFVGKVLPCSERNDNGDVLVISRKNDIRTYDSCHVAHFFDCQVVDGFVLPPPKGNNDVEKAAFTQNILWQIKHKNKNKALFNAIAIAFGIQQDSYFDKILE
jgi:hypothetical protein